MCTVPALLPMVPYSAGSPRYLVSRAAVRAPLDLRIGNPDFSAGLPRAGTSLTADVRSPETTFDALREKILTSDCSSGFLAGREKRGYRLLGISYYSTTRQIVPLVEIVKRAVQMIRELATEAGVDLSGGNVVMHYPNIFPQAWDMVSQYEVPKERHMLAARRWAHARFRIQ